MKNQNNTPYSIDRLNESRHPYLPNFGPYGKIYAGISHLLTEQKQMTEWLFAFQGENKKALLPNHMEVSKNNNFHPFGANAGLKYFCYKFDIEGFEDIYALANCYPTDNSCLLILKLVNNTDNKYELDFECCGFTHHEEEKHLRVDLSTNDIWIGAENYIECKTWYTRMADGYRNLVTKNDSAIDGQSVSRGWATTPDTRLTYSFTYATKFENLKIGIRYLKENHENFLYRLEIDNHRFEFNFDISVDWSVQWFEIGELKPGTHQLVLTVLPCDTSNMKRGLFGDMEYSINLDGFIISTKQVLKIKPAYTSTSDSESFKRNKENELHTIEFKDKQAFVLEVQEAENLNVQFQEKTALYANAPYYSEQISKNELGTLTIEEISIPPKGSKEIKLRIAYGETLEIAKNHLQNIPEKLPIKNSNNEIPETYRFGYHLLASNTLMNISYPASTPNDLFATWAPGKGFGNLYAWDAGMHGIGLLQIDLNAAIEILNAYLCGDKEEQDFIWHGTPIPTQAYLLNEIYQKTHDKKLLMYFYPRIRRFYEHLIGRAEGSKTNRFNNHLINTFPIFYNSGGWDDLPPQVEMHKKALLDQVSPVSSTAHLIRFSKFMIRFSMALNLKEDEEIYLNDIQNGLAAIEKTWDTKEQLYSFVWHDTFQPFIHKESNINFNHTLDSMTPLISGSIQKDRIKILLERLQDKNKYFSHVGLSTVDMTAPYYNPTGYWNGSVWIPHQWFLFKASLDYGEVEFALELAKVVCDTWERESQRTHSSFEHFKINTGKGAGFPHFAGLSSPALQFISSISQQDSVTGGFDWEIKEIKILSNGISFCCKSDLFNTNEKGSFIAVLRNPGTYQLTIDGINQTIKTNSIGTIGIKIPTIFDWTTITITKLKQ